jgi:phosphocarrier protein HPr
MIERQVEILNPLGLHARAAARFVRLASQFRARVRVERSGRVMDGKSILGMLLLAASQGSRLTLIIEGEDEQRAAEALGALVAAGFGEVAE